jgi:hypothetical protein
MKFSFYQTTPVGNSSEVRVVEAVKGEEIETEAMVDDEVDFDERDEKSEKVVEEENRVEEADEKDNSIAGGEHDREEDMVLFNVSTTCDQEDTVKCNEFEVAFDATDCPIERVASNDSVESNNSIHSKASEISHKLEAIMLDRIAAIDQIRNLLETELENGKIISCDVLSIF